MTTIPYLHADEEDDNLVSLTSIFNAIKSKLNITPGVIGEWLRPGTVDPSELYVTLKVQREVSTLQLNSYKQFNRAFARPLIVGIRPNGKKVDVDGQHTALLILASLYPEDLPCFYIDHPKDRSVENCEKIEAEVFYALNTFRKDPTHVDKMKAGLAFNMPDAVKYNDNLFSCNIYIEGYDYLGDPDGTPMEGEYQWRKAIEKFGTTTVAKACSKLSELQEYDNWRHPKKNKTVTSIRADMIMILSTLYDFIKRAKIAGKMKDKEKSILNYIDNKLVDFERKKWYNGISGASTGIIGALRIINSHNESAGSTVIGESLLKQFGLVDPSK
tara:strand:+ start:105 stop:1091 length:987 start_codon:yes stop_codon:yes gene_type:complete